MQSKFFLQQFLYALLLVTSTSAAYSNTDLAIDESDTPATQNWYQIEIIIFKNLSSDNEFEELWRPVNDLAYPLNLQYLRDPNNPEQQSISTLSSQQNTPNDKIADEATTENNDVAIPKLTLLDSKERQLNESAGGINRNPNYRVLVHQAWRQPLPPGSADSNIHIKGGTPFGDNSELQGWLSLKRTRFLHVSTELWLSQFSANYGQESNWPLLPIPFEEGMENPKNTSAETLVFGQNTTSNNSFGLNYKRLLDNEYIVERTAAMQQSRRMRSNELHYIDHPLFGMVIQVSRYVPPSAESEEPTTEPVAN